MTKSQSKRQITLQIIIDVVIWLAGRLFHVIHVVFLIILGAIYFFFFYFILFFFFKIMTVKNLLVFNMNLRRANR